LLVYETGGYLPAIIIARSEGLKSLFDEASNFGYSV
jgi:hypothetical protein